MRKEFVMVGAIALTLIGLPAFAQDSPDTNAHHLPRFTRPAAPAVAQEVPSVTPTIQRDQAPLPLGEVLQTPIDRFEPAFADVPRDHWAYDAVTRLFYSGIVSGYSTNQQ